MQQRGARRGSEFFRRESAAAYDVLSEEELVKLGAMLENIEQNANEYVEIASLLGDVAKHFTDNPVMRPKPLISRSSRLKEMATLNSKLGLERSILDMAALDATQEAARPGFNLVNGLGLKKLNSDLLDDGKIKMWGDQDETEAMRKRLGSMGQPVADINPEGELVRHDTNELYLNRYIGRNNNVPELLHGLAHLKTGNRGISREIVPMHVTKRISSFYRDLGKPVRTFDFTLLDILQDSPKFKSALEKLQSLRRAGFPRTKENPYPVYKILNAHRYYIGVMLAIPCDNQNAPLKDMFKTNDDLLFDMFMGAITPKEITHEVRLEAAKARRHEKSVN